MKFYSLFLSVIFTFSIQAQELSKSEIIKYSKDNALKSISRLVEFLEIPNNGRIVSHRNANLNWCKNAFDALGFKTSIEYSDSIPHLLALKDVGDDLKTVLFYLQIDGQPVDTTKWDQADPYKPVLKVKNGDHWQSISFSDLENGIMEDSRIYARSASDSKGPAMALISALQIMQNEEIEAKFNIRVIMDFQEELGSPTLPKLVRQKPNLFQADLMLIMDGTRHLSGLPTLTFGARGIAMVTLKVFGAKNDLHSGQYGNFSPNPVFTMAHLLSDIKDENGRVSIPGFYNDISFSPEELKAINNIPEDLIDIKSTLGIATIDSVGSTYSEALQYPTLNVRGLRAAWVGKEVRTLIPSEAIAEIDMRLVPETPAERQINLLKEFIISKGFFLVDSIPTDLERVEHPKLASFSYKIGSKPFRTELDSDIGRWLAQAMDRIFADRFVKMRTTGGSQPIAPFINTLQIPAVSIRIPNPDNNIHAPNENIRLGNFIEGIQICLSILSQDPY